MRIADKSTCSADGFGWLEACTNLIILMMVRVTLIVMMMAMYVTVMLTLMTLVLKITSRAASQEDLGRRGGGQSGRERTIRAVACSAGDDQG